MIRFRFFAAVFLSLALSSSLAFFLSLAFFSGETLFMGTALASQKPVIRVGSKIFTEGFVISEIIAQTIEKAGEATVNRKFGLGGTGILYEALTHNAIDIYPEYSGTVSETILKEPKKMSISNIRAALAPINLTITDSLGFNNTYAIAVRGDIAKDFKLRTISDLALHPDLLAGFSNEFLKRPDGFPGLQAFYNLNMNNVKGMEHSLAYEALDKKEIDLTDVYSTDAKIEKFNLAVLDDDKKFFPDYYAVILVRKDFPHLYPRTWHALRNLEGRFSETRVIRLNSLVEIDKKEFSEVAADFLKDRTPTITEDRKEIFEKIWKYTKQHVYLVGVSLFFAILVGLPLGVVSVRYQVLGQLILLVSGILQTIPSLALLCFLIPVFGIGALPALVALFLYSLLPIVMGTYTGIQNIDVRLLEASRALGLTQWQRLKFVELPLASPTIMSGIKTSAIIGIGTATLSALIGAGGYGSPIVTGLALNDINTILQGAIPAALMALLTHALFQILNRILIPRGLPKQ